MPLWYESHGRRSKQYTQFDDTFLRTDISVHVKGTINVGVCLRVRASWPLKAPRGCSQNRPKRRLRCWFVCIWFHWVMLVINMTSEADWKSDIISYDKLLVLVWVDDVMMSSKWTWMLVCWCASVILIHKQMTWGKFDGFCLNVII